MRTLEDMKRDRGGHCHNCGKDIMDASQEDHTFCNDCWYKMLAHPFETDPEDPENPFCYNCDEDEDSLYHKIAAPE